MQQPQAWMWVGLSGKARFPALQTAAYEDAANTSVLPHRPQVLILDHLYREVGHPTSGCLQNASDSLRPHYPLQDHLWLYLTLTVQLYYLI